MTPPSSDPPRSDASESLADRTLAACLDRAEKHAEAVVERVCRTHPDRAEAIRERIDAIRSGWLQGSGESTPPEGLQWEEDERDDADREFEPIGHYQPLEELGRGGQAVVYLAEDRRLHRKVALKVLTGFGPLSEEAKSRFQREAEVASKLEQPGICAVYDSGVEQGIPYMAMRHVEGESLAEKLAAARAAQKSDSSVSCIDPSSAGSADRGAMLLVVELIERVARALHQAHEAGVLHRDVKPANIMVTPAGEPVLMDFGLARELAGEAETLTRSGAFFGTPAYMSPEQLATRRVRLDRRTDIYSLAATLYECVTLTRPFDAPTREALARRIRLEEPPDPRSLNPRIPTDLKVVLDKALEKERDRRYSTAHAFAEDLRRVRVSEPIEARPIGPVGRLIRWRRRQPAFAALVIALVIGLPLLTGLGAYVIGKLPDVRAARAQALQDEVESFLVDGYSELAHGSQEAAIAAFDRALQHMPDSAEAVGGRALAMMEKKQYAACLRFLDRHRELSGTVPDLKRLRVDVLRHLGRNGEADDLKKTIREPTTTLGYFLAGSHLMGGCTRQRDKTVFRKAVIHFFEATLNSEQPRQLHYFELAHAAGHLADPAWSERAFLALTTHFADSSRAWEWAGYAVKDVDHERAVLASRKALALRPDDPIAWTFLAIALFQLERWEEALAASQRATELNPAGASTHATHLRILVGLQRWDEVIASGKEALARWPDHAWIHTQIGIAHLANGRNEMAERASRRAIQKGCQGPGVYGNLGLSLLNRGRFDEALKFLCEAHARRSRVPNWPYPSDKWVDESKRLKDIAPQLEAVIRGEEQPADARAERSLATVAYCTQRLGASVALYQAAFDREPAMADDRDPFFAYPQTLRFTAACTAARAAAGEGIDAKNFDATDRSRWRENALAWLQQDLAALEEQLNDGGMTSSELKERLRGAGIGPGWKSWWPLASVRDPEGLAKIPESERRAWAAFWQSVDALLDRMK